MEKVVDLNRWQKAHVKSQEELQALFEELRANFQVKPYPELPHRLQILSQLKKALIEHQSELITALNEDYGYRSDFDSMICDLLPTIDHLNYSCKNLKQWAKPSRRRAGLLLAPSRLKVLYQPLGVVGVIVPWNFPIFLSIAPVVTALAAGNRVMVKLSEHTPNTNQILSKIFAQLDSHVCTVEGEVDIAQFFSQLPFDHLLFTGSTKVGRMVAEQAAKNLTPVTLELGGKSPVIIAPDADIDKAVATILMGKSLNAGQICVAPDYVLLPEEKQRVFVESYLRQYRQAYLQQPHGSGMTRIINQQQFERLNAYLDDAKSKGGKVYTLEASSLAEREMLPHLITTLSDDMLLTEEEIFGPILPIIGYHHVKQAIEYIQARPRPLALYLMTQDKALIEQVSLQTHSGGLCINDVLLQVTAHDAPFGGIGESGMGHYHGVEGFRSLSQAKTVLMTPRWLPRARWIIQYRNQIKKWLSALFIK
ncbi:coniferyl aldehyde dehydrogenase [Vibrio ichthyoenteri ATCC 700023]|uniref:Aldehyde dehydrogenase n=1 Tax=Vibrio ichthyoenteri ATCC 700023 TaxID=870968 RepID=F9RYR6_9VIBR|nr:coniferyl aldehyde dehydrogenase [Vibrio ichthyoenteri]EGU46276.1 coniferyl aldehyde dehydrogenase [Vibrio ichthyoenteri ATCC 700023]